MTSAERTADKKARREERERTVANLIRTNNERLSHKSYGIILADPPWRYETYSQETGMDRSAENHYPTMSTEEIARLAIPAAKDSILYLWRTAPMMMAAIAVMLRWGFVYKSEHVWTKDRAITGYWNRGQHEVLMVATRGHPVAPAPGTQNSSWLHAATSTHSTKPDNFHFMIESLWPNTPKIELFARRRRPGWDYMYSPELKP